jgi:hypothetical protein
MAIKISRNEAGNCINFIGSTQPAYWNACLSAQINTEDNTRINILNDIRSNVEGEVVYEFYAVPFVDFVDSNGQAFADVQAAVDYININANVSAPTDVSVAYLGVYDATANSPDITTDVSGFDNGEWYFVNVAGTQTFNGTEYNLEVNDQIRFNSLNSDWDVIVDTNAKVSEIENSSLNLYDIHVDGTYTGTIRSGSSVHPYPTLTEAIDNSFPGNSISIKGSILIENSSTDAFTLPHSLHFYGNDECEIGYNSYDATNGDVFNFSGIDNSQDFIFKNIKIKNAGGYGIYTNKAKSVLVESCELTNNGWNGLGLSTVLADNGSDRGYDSAQADLQAFYAGSNASNGGAMRIQESGTVNVIACVIHKNLGGVRVQDCGINGGGFISRNRSYENIESGIYLATGGLGGCQNITVTNNYSGFNANNGMLIVGGLNNKFSQNEIKGNWSAGVCNWASGNLTLRDSALYDNNRSNYNGIGNVGDAKASIQINDVYSFLETVFVANPDARFIMEILDTQVHYTGLGSNIEKVGLLLTSGMGNIPASEHNIINIDDVGFIGQDVAIDLSEVDVTNMQLSLGDCRYQNIANTAVKPPLNGNYSELPFSNHVTSVISLDVAVDTLKGMISLTEGVGGNVINTYKSNELQSVIRGTEVDIIQKGSDKIQLRGLTQGNVTVNGVVAGNNLNSMNDTLNAAFQMDLVEYKDFLVSEVGINGDESSGGSLPAIANNWYVSYGTLAGTQITQGTIGNTYGNHNPFYNGEALEKGHEFVWTHNPTVGYLIGIWGAAEAAQSGSSALQPSNWTVGFAYASTNTRFSQPDSSGVTIQQSGSFAGYYGMPNGQLAIRFGQDNYLYLYEIVNGGYNLIGKSNSTVAGTSVMIQWASFNEGSFPVMTERTESWEVVHDFDNSQGGEWSNGLELSTIIKSRVSVNPGQKLTLNLSYFGRSEKIGLGYTGASTGVVGAEDTLVTPLFYNTAEVLKEQGAAEVNWTWNTSASGSYDPQGDRSDIGYDNGTQLGLISFRYNSDNSLELWHETNNELIATRKVDLDGSAFHIYLGANEDNHTADRIPQLIKYDMSAEEEGASLTGWYYIESPDGEFYYPLFATEAEANYIDTVEGGSGTSHTHTFADDLHDGGTNTWYMPDTSGVHAGTSAPQGGIFGNSINVVWNEIPTGDDSNYLPTFNNITYNVQEGSAINIQYKAQGMTETFNVTNVPAGYADNGTAIIGTAEDITNGYGQSVTHTLNVTKANNFGSVQGTITINVLANLSGNEFTLVDQGGAIKFTQDGGATTLDFNTVTFNAGSTYKFYLDGSTLQTNDFVDIVDANGNGLTGGDGLLQTGGSGPGYAGTYLQYTIPSDVAPGKFIRFTDGATSTTYTDVPLTIAGSSYTADPIGVDLEGPAANQSGSVIVPVNGYSKHGWLSLDETLAAGQRLILNNAFFTDLLGYANSNAGYADYEFAIGLKGDSWANTQKTTGSNSAASGIFKGDAYLSIRIQSSYNVRIKAYANGNASNEMLVNTGALHNTVCAFLDITSTGNNIRLGFGRNGDAGVTSGDESTVTYADWNSYKVQTGAQGYGITELDVMFLAYNSWGATAEFDTDEIDWTNLSEISIPVAPTMVTNWSKTADFSGGNEHLKQVSTNSSVNALRMGGKSVTVPVNADSTKTASDSQATPWATTILFKSDRHNSNQHIWNNGEGTTTGDDNIFLRHSAAGELIFAWGREGSGYNECSLGTVNSSDWYGVYIAHKGQRLSGANATATNLAAAFDIRIMTSSDSFNSLGSNLSTSSNWNSTGARMDRSVLGDFTIGGRGSNRNFHGKVAGMVVTTLRSNFDMPTDAEIKLMITDPKKWEDDYRVGQLVRWTYSTSVTTYTPSNFTYGYGPVQIWLMGDGGSDSYSNGIRNEVYAADQNYTKLQFNSMASDDIQNVTIPGLT